MSYPSAPLAVGTYDYEVNANLNPPVPSYTAGNLLLCFSTSQLGTAPTPATPTGWTLIAVSAGGQIVVWGKIAGTGEVSPTISWGNVPANAIIINYGGSFTTLPGIHASNTKTNTSVNQIGYGSLGVTVNGCLVISFGVRDKTSATDTATIGTLTGFTLRSSYVHSANFFASVINDQVQTTATTIAAMAQTWSVSDATAQAYESITFALLPNNPLVAGAVDTTSAAGMIASAPLAGSGRDTSAASAALNTAILLAGVATSASSASAGLTNYATVTLSSVPYIGIGSVYDPNFWLDIVPVQGDTLYYDATYITIAIDGSISSTSNTCSALVQFNHGAGWALGIVTFTPTMVGYADTAISATAMTALATAISLSSTAADATTAAAALINFASVTLTSNLYTGIGSIYDPNFWMDIVPTVGDTLYYDGTYLLIAPDGTTSATSNNFSALVQFNHGSGWAQGIVTYTPGLVSYADTATSAVGVLSSGATIAGAATTIIGAAARLSTQITLAAQAMDATAAQGLLGKYATFSAAAADLTSATAALQTAIIIASAAFLSTSAAGLLDSGAVLQAAAIDQVTGRAQISTQIQLTSGATGTTSATGQLLGNSARFVSNAATSIVASGVLSTLISLGTRAAETVTAYGALATQIQVVASAFDSTAAMGNLLTGTIITGAAADTTGASGNISTMVLFAGAAADLLTASASLITQIQLVGNALDFTSAQANLLVALDSDAYTTTVATGDLTTQAQDSTETIWVLG